MDYSKSRKMQGETIHRFFGEPGLKFADAHYAGAAHQNALALLRQRVTDQGFASGLTPVERAEIELLATSPQDFVSCTARRGRAA